jgi:hypothetical protein
MPAEHPSALQLRMTDLDDQATQRALAWQRLGTDTSWERSTDTSWERIVRRAHEFEHRASAGKQLVVGPNPANPGQDPGLYEFDGVQMLREPCHRECSLYVAGWTRSG